MLIKHLSEELYINLSKNPVAQKLFIGLVALLTISLLMALLFVREADNQK